MGNNCCGERKEGEENKEKNIFDHIGDSVKGGLDAAQKAAEDAKNAAESGIKSAGDMVPKDGSAAAAPATTAK